MSTKVIARIIVTCIILVLIGIIYILWSNGKQSAPDNLAEAPAVEQSAKSALVESDTATDRLKDIEDDITKLKKMVKEQKSLIDTLSEGNATSEAQLVKISSKNVLATAHTKGSLFSTTSTAYSPMSMFVNIACPVQCTLWIDFYTTSKNNSANNENTYGLFLNGQDQSLYSKAVLPTTNGSASISLNDAIPVGAGTYTVEIQAKTSGGTLQSDISFLQVLAIER